jgi:hypothetical protein
LAELERGDSERPAQQVSSNRLEERLAAELSARSRFTLRRSVGSPLLFSVVYTSLASAIYFSLGVIAGRALGLTRLVFLISALLFALTAMTYAPRCARSAAVRPCSPATPSTSSSASSPAGRSCSTTSS